MRFSFLLFGRGLYSIILWCIFSFIILCCVIYQCSLFCCWNNTLHILKRFLWREMELFNRVLWIMVTVNNTYLVKNKNFTVISLDQFFVHQVQYTTRRCNDHVYCTPFIHCVFVSISRSTVLCLHWSRLHCTSYIDKTVCQPSSNTHGNSMIWFLVIPGAIYVPVAIKYRQAWELRTQQQYTQRRFKVLRVNT